MAQPLWEMVWWFLTELNILLPYDLAVVLLSIYSSELKTSVYTKICTQMFIASSFIYNCQNLEAIRMSLSRLMDKLQHILTMECYSTLERNE